MLLIGDPRDAHIAAVLAHLPRAGTAVLDAASLKETLQQLDLQSIRLRDLDGAALEISSLAPQRGWIRRLAPPAWDHGVGLGSHRAAVLSARLSTLAALLRDPSILWLTPVDQLFAAENKIVQYRGAIEVGVPVPTTVISPDRSVLAAELGEPFVMKPIGLGNFQGDGQQQRVALARDVRASDLENVDLLEAPFLAQSRVNATVHLRVVTVNEQAWMAELDATNLPRDWRQHTQAHYSFRAGSRWPGVRELAIRLAAFLGVGMSSQDWAVGKDGPVFLDLNPGGQWLFLPSEVADPVTQAIAEWLAD